MEAIVNFISEHAIEIIGFILGLFYLYCEYNASNWVWFFGLLMPMVSMVVYFNAGLYADFSINIYYLLASVYGLFKWRGTKSRKGVNISHITPSLAVASAIAMLSIWLGIYLMLSNFTDSNVPVLDALTTALSVVGTWMLAHKYIEQWLIWIIVDIICTGLYIYKDIPFYAVLYAAYTVVAFSGYRKWQSMMSTQG